MNPDKTFLIIGHSGHGKDTVAEWMKNVHGISYNSSSWYACTDFISDALNTATPIHRTKSPKFHHADRDDWRALWYHLICYYNKDNPARLANELMKTADCYVGMRSLDEYNASVSLFDVVIWVDASRRLPAEPPTSMDLNASHAHYTVDNNGTEAELHERLDTLFKFLGYGN